MVRFCLCNDERASFKVVYYLLKKPTRIKKKEIDTESITWENLQQHYAAFRGIFLHME